MTSIYLKRVGIAAPGLPNWETACAVLNGKQDYEAAEMPKYAPGVLPPNERRRATQVARLAFQAAEDAVGGADATGLERIAAVFASSGGDTEVLNKICTMLAMPDRPVSPTQFHNSVHNAAAGYWSIATGSRLPSTALSSHDGSFVAGVLEAVSMAAAECVPVLLVAYDLNTPKPLYAKRPVEQSFAAALLMTPDSDGAMARMDVRLQNGAGGEPTTMVDTALESLRIGNPAARALPLLSAIAAGEEACVIIPGLSDESLCLEITAC